MSRRGYLKKIIDIDKMTEMRQRVEVSGRRCVLAHGIFDIIHPGHTRHLEWARRQGDILLVTVADDDLGIRTRTPIDIRMENISALAMVDYVAKVPSLDATHSIEKLKPAVLVRGMEFHGLHADIAAKEQKALESYGGEILFSSGDPAYTNIRTAELEGNYLKGRWTVLYEVLERQGIVPGRFEALLEGFQDLRVMVFGDSIVEEYIHSEALGLAAEDPVIVVKPKRSERYLGGAAGVAEHAAGLGARVELFSVVGDDQSANFMRQRAESSSVHYQLFTDESRPTTLKQRFLAGRKKLMRANYFEEHPIRDRLVKEIIDKISPRLEDMDLLLFWDGGYGVVEETLHNQLVSRAQEVGVKIGAMAPCSTQIANVDRYQDLDFVVSTEREVRMSCWDTQNSLVQLGLSLLERTRNQSLIISLGEDGTLVLDREGKKEYLPTFSKEILDPLGAMDAMMVATALGRGAGGTIFEAAILGCSAYALEVTLGGNSPVEREKIQAQLLEQIYSEDFQINISKHQLASTLTGEIELR